MKYKDLHNEIFSETSCLTKEQIDKLLANKLSDKELYAIEKHLIDCPLCNEAVEGYLANPVTISTEQLDELIDKKTASHKKNHLKDYLLVAASIALLLGIANLGINHFPNQNQNKELSINQSNTEKEEAETGFAPVKENKVELETIENSSTIDNKLPETQKETASDIALQNNAIENEIEMQEEIEVQQEDELVNPLTESSAQEEPALNDEEIKTEFYDDSENNEENSLKSAKPTTAPSMASAPARTITKSPAKQKVTAKKSKYDQKTLYVKGFKIYDYTTEYAKKEQTQKLAESLSVSPAMENENDHNAAFDTSIIEKKTYVQILESALEDLKQKNYPKAIRKFSTIEQKEPNDVNALFYKGIAYEEQENWQKALKYFDKTLNEKVSIFHEEAKFHKAKVLIELNEKKKAKKILKEIVNEQSFYAPQAQKLLDSLKDE